MGLKGFHVRSLPPNGPMQKPATHASLHNIANEGSPPDLAHVCTGMYAPQQHMHKRLLKRPFVFFPFLGMHAGYSLVFSSIATEVAGEISHSPLTFRMGPQWQQPCPGHQCTP